jgi:hypothetical protein
MNAVVARPSRSPDEGVSAEAHPALAQDDMQASVGERSAPGSLVHRKEKAAAEPASARDFDQRSCDKT